MMLLEITGYSLLEQPQGQAEGQGEGAVRVTDSRHKNPVCPPRPGWEAHLCSRATRRSLSSLPRNPLAKGLFSIFSCVICQERTHSRVAGVEGRAGLWPSSPTPGTVRTHGRGQEGACPSPGPARSLAGSSMASPLTSCHWLLSTLLAADPPSPPWALPVLLASVPHHPLLGACNSFLATSPLSSATATSGSE